MIDHRLYYVKLLYIRYLKEEPCQMALNTCFLERKEDNKKQKKKRTEKKVLTFF